MYIVLGSKEGEMLYALNLPSSQATSSHPGKAKIYEPEALNETMLSMRRKKSLTSSHAQHRTSPIPTPISIKEKEWVCEKKIEDSHQLQKT